MPVSGKEEPRVLSRKSSTDISAGIPLKKRRFLLSPPSSPPREEVVPEVNDLKKHEESTPDTTNKEKFVTDSTENQESSLELKKKEASSADVTYGEESGLEQASKEDSGSELGSKQEFGSGLQDSIASRPGLKNNQISSSNPGPSSINVAVRSPEKSDASKINLLEVKKECVSAPNANLDNLDTDVSGVKLPELSPMFNLGSANRVESNTDLLLTGKLASSGVPGTPVGAALVRVKKEMHNKLVEDDFKLKLATGLGNNGKLALGPKEFLIPGLNVDPSLLSLSLSKEKHVTEERSGDTSLKGDSKSECANRSNWDLNTTMDAWEGSIGDTTFQGTIGGSGKTISLNDRRLLSSNSIVNVSSVKEKQVNATREPRSSFPNSSVQLIKPSEDSLRLTLSSSFGNVDFVRERTGLSAEVAPRMDISTNRHSGLLSTEDKKSPGVSVVKLEPSDENSKNSSVGTIKRSVELSDFNAVKREPIEKHNAEAVKLLASSPQDTTEQRSIKPEPTNEVSQELCRTSDLRLQQSIPMFVHSQESFSSSSVLPTPLTPQKPSPSRIPTSSDLSTSADVSNQSERSTHTKEPHMGSDGFLQAPADMNPKTAHHRVREENMAAHKMGNNEAEDMNVDHPELKRTKEHVHDLRAHGEGSVSDEEKINISAETMEDESYGSECESDGKQVVVSKFLHGRVGRDDDDYEDGEVRDPLENSKIEELTADGSADSAKHGDCDNKHCPSGFPGGDTYTDQSCLVHKENDLKIHDNTAVDCIKESVGTVSNKNCEQLMAKDGHSDKLPLDGMATTDADEEPCSSSQRKLLEPTGKKSSQKSIEKDMSCDGTTSSGIRTVPAAGEPKGQIAKAVNTDEKPDSSLSKVEDSLNGNSAAKNSTSGGNKSRIINLPRASAISPSKTRSIPDRLLSSRNGRGRYSDPDGEKFIPRGKRDEIDADNPHRFLRERIQDQSFRNSRSNYTRGRGKFSGRLDTSRGEWGSNRDFAFGSYNDDYRFTRNKHAAAIADTELECNDFVIPPDGASLSIGRGRKSLNDDLPSFRRPSSRRLSPGGRDGPGSREIQMVHRIPRNISPGRLNDDNGVDLVGLRQDGKYARDLPDGIIEPAYTRPNSMYEGGNTQFVRGNRNFSTFQRRGFPQVRSKSPVGSRTRSPGPWTSPRRRSPAGFGGLQQLAQHRSPAMYRVERMRSPDRSCFPEDMVARRRGSPSFLARPSDDVRDVDSAREHGHPRPINSSRRSPSDRVFSRSTRRVDVLEPRIRTSGDEYFGRPVPSGRFQEFHGEGSSEERRKCGESRGLIRSFRPPYISDSDNLRFQLDDGPRPFRFCSEGDADFVGRGIREREFDGRMKGRPVAAPRRIRTIEDQEGNYRESGQVWHDDGFNEGSGYKRRRF